MSGPGEEDGHLEDSGSVLANLPRTRPQRATARRVATRRAAKAEPSANTNGNGSRPREKPEKAPRKKSAAAVPGRSTKNKPATASKARANGASAATAAGSSRAPAAKRPRKNAKRPAKAAPAQEVPRQGFECEYDLATGAVPPPGTADFLSTAVEALGELAKAGISGSERLLQDVFSRLGR